jgi:anthranilate synthase component I
VKTSFSEGKSEIHDFRENETENLPTAEPLKSLRSILSNYAAPKINQRFLGGAIGYFSYDAVRHWERLPTLGNEYGPFPDAEFIIFNEGLIFDHETDEAYRYALDQHEVTQLPFEDGVETEPFQAEIFAPEPDEEHYKQIVAEAKKYIESGDIFQVVLSKRYPIAFRGDPIDFYQHLRKLNPSPYMYYLKFNQRIIAGASPEMLVRVEGRSVETFPIAGTRPYRGVESEDAAMRKELANDPKELAEHTMLVDLARNDLGKVCDFGSVSLHNSMKIESYSHVQHIVSHVTGHLRSGSDCYDVLRAVFPAGTVSGAPKIRAMEVIDELEKTRRGPYAGAVGYFSFNGNADFAITIRTLIAQGRSGYVQAGAGIVADSNPQKEWEETDHKASSILQAINSEVEL